MFAGGLRGRRSRERVQRLEEDVGRTDDGDARHAERDRLRAPRADERDGVARFGLQRRGELLVEHDLTLSQRPAQVAERREMAEVVPARHGEDRAVAGADRARGGDVRHPGERRGCDGSRTEDVLLVRNTGGRARRGGIRADRRLPVDRHAANGAAGHRLQRMPDEEQHRAEQRDGGGEREHAQNGAAGRAQQTDEREPRERDHASTGLSTICPSCSSTTRGSARRRRRRASRRRARTVALLQREDQVEHACRGVRVEVTRRLVAEQELRPLCERTRECDALRLPAGELCGKVVFFPRETDERQQLRRLERGLGDVRCERDVLVGGEVGEEVRALEDVGDPAGACPRARAPASSVEIGSPSSSTVPDATSTSPPSTWSSVVLPEPDRPMSATESAPAARDRRRGAP